MNCDDTDIKTINKTRSLANTAIIDAVKIETQEDVWNSMVDIVRQVAEGSDIETVCFDASSAVAEDL